MRKDVILWRLFLLLNSVKIKIKNVNLHLVKLY